MLQQTRVKTVVSYYKRFVDAFPTVKQLAQSRKEKVLGLWAGLGYYRRAENLLRASKIICEEHEGQFPSDRKAALALPGVGVYTAGAVLSIAYCLPEVILDGNIKRVLARLLCVETVDSKAEKKFRVLLEELVHSSTVRPQIRSFNQALMELGALVCTPRSPSCNNCPLKQFCQARKSGVEKQIPTPKKKRPAEEHLFISAIILDKRMCPLLVRNETDSYLRNFWEFPKVTGVYSGLHRSFFVEHALCLQPVQKLKEIKHQVTFRKLRFTPVVCRLLKPLTERPGWIWEDPKQVSVPTSSYVLKIWEQYQWWSALEQKLEAPQKRSDKGKQSSW